MTDLARAWADSTQLNLRDPDALVDLIHVEDAAAAFLQAAPLLEARVQLDARGPHGPP
jgi:hypothetical protein